MTRILLVEDQATAAAYLGQGLREAGLAVDVALTGPDGLRHMLTIDYDLAVLDVMLPGIDGWAILAAARRAQVRTPVLFLSARDDIDDRVRGLALGAEDYLAKPYAFSELLARVRVILRRNLGQDAPLERSLFTIDDLTLDLLKHQASRGGERIELTPKEFALLALLMRRAGEVQSRTVIAAIVWDMHFASGTNVVEVAIRRLRTRIDDPFARKLLHTVRGVGYVLELRDQAAAS
jgi:two-component system copper resistance phosphate regulon response regulator CusR